jgi:hypothetical protein
VAADPALIALAAGSVLDRASGSSPRPTSVALVPAGVDPEASVEEGLDRGRPLALGLAAMLALGLMAATLGGRRWSERRRSMARVAARLGALDRDLTGSGRTPDPGAAAASVTDPRATLGAGAPGPS